MPFTVITLKNVPPSLRGDLTKWMQEIATGVYVGNFNSRVRENLWKRVCDARGTGEATMSYMCQNEIGYDFMTINADRKVIDYEGIPLILLPEKALQTKGQEETTHFSNAYKMHKARMNSSNTIKAKKEYPIVVIDIETTGLDPFKDQILEIGAVKYIDEERITFQKLIRINNSVPEKITQLTGITDQMINEHGVSLKSALLDLLSFVSNYHIYGYNISFDISFLNQAYKKLSLNTLENKVFDLKEKVKKENLFQKNYKLQTTLKNYGINQTVPHRALGDALLIYDLYKKMNKQ